MEKKQAVERWLSEFNQVPLSLLNRAFKDNIEDFVEITQPAKHSRVWASEQEVAVTIKDINYEERRAIVTDDVDTFLLPLDELSVTFDDYLPAWNTMFSFKNDLDDSWVRDNLEAVSSCGFRIYEDVIDSTIYLGIDGAGYNFMDHHWIPLYDARGLKWHTEE